jgi:hypothetical protein
VADVDCGRTRLITICVLAFHLCHFRSRL